MKLLISVIHRKSFKKKKLFQYGNDASLFYTAIFGTILSWKYQFHHMKIKKNILSSQTNVE